MRLLALALLTLHAGFAAAAAVNFDSQPAGSPPQGWTCGVTGSGAPRWLIERDPGAPSRPNVLRQSGQGAFPWCVKDSVSIADGHVEVKFKPIAGGEDQAGGLVWRFRSGDEYYVARANALENNVSLYFTKRGTRHTIKYVNAPVAANRWHLLRVDFRGGSIRVSLDGMPYIVLTDDHITEAGSVGVWTKADSVTAFDDFEYGEAQGH